MTKRRSRPRQPPDKTKILLDTDIGNNIDDALCLAYLLAQPRADVLGITTVGREPDLRARLARHLVAAAGADVPVVAGAGRPLVVQGPGRGVARRLWPWLEDDAPAQAALDDASAYPGEGVAFLRQVAHAHPGEVVLVATGPLTNVGLLAALYPRVAAELRAVVTMSGVFLPTRKAIEPIESNARADPHGAALAYGAPVADLLAVGLDVTRLLARPAAEVAQRGKDKGWLEPLADSLEAWARDEKRVVFNDPLAAVSVFASEACTFVPGRVSIELGAVGCGTTHFAQEAAPSAPHRVGVRVREAAFFDHLYGVLDSPH